MNAQEILTAVQVQAVLADGRVPEVLAVVKKIIQETGAESMKDMGKIMGPAMKELSGKADGKLVQACVRKVLG